MSRRSWMPLYVSDYIGDTGHLSTLQHGAYFLLILHYWAKGSLPDDDHQLAKITRMRIEDWRRNRPILQAFFHDGWKHKRIEAELRRSVEIGVKRAVAGSKGGTVASINRFRKH
jgi:uncharacterized protein YdaU (DUF1376 family)